MIFKVVKCFSLSTITGDACKTLFERKKLKFLNFRNLGKSKEKEEFESFLEGVKKELDILDMKKVDFKESKYSLL